MVTQSPSILKETSMGVLVAQSWPTLCDSMDCSLPDSSVHGIFLHWQADSLPLSPRESQLKAYWQWNLLNCVRLFATSWTIQSMEFFRPEYWSRLSFPSPGDLPNPGIKPRSPTLQANSLPTEPPGSPKAHWAYLIHLRIDRKDFLHLEFLFQLLISAGRWADLARKSQTSFCTKGMLEMEHCIRWSPVTPLDGAQSLPVVLRGVGHALCDLMRAPRAPLVGASMWKDLSSLWNLLLFVGSWIQFQSIFYCHITKQKTESPKSLFVRPS